jgi:hypothetical protein
MSASDLPNEQVHWGDCDNCHGHYRLRVSGYLKSDAGDGVTKTIEEWLCRKCYRQRIDDIPKKGSASA